MIQKRSSPVFPPPLKFSPPSLCIYIRYVYVINFFRVRTHTSTLLFKLQHSIPYCEHIFIHFLFFLLNCSQFFVIANNAKKKPQNKNPTPFLIHASLGTCSHFNFNVLLKAYFWVVGGLTIPNK